MELEPLEPIPPVAYELYISTSVQTTPIFNSTNTFKNRLV